jgi:hypothetical protein
MQPASDFASARRRATARASPDGINPHQQISAKLVDGAPVRPPGGPDRDLLFPVDNSHPPSFGDCELVLFD